MILRDAIGAAPCARECMLDPPHRHARSQHVAEHLQLRATETLTSRGGGADRAMILQQQEAVRIGAPFGHVAFAGTQLRQPRDPCPERGELGERGAVGASGFLFARAHQSFQRGLAECRPHGLDQAHGEFRMGIRETTVR